jgi:BASS family bile acid:Na+ symporter
MLRNHGLLTVGKSIADAFLSMYTFENTCRIQIDAQAGGELANWAINTFAKTGQVVPLQFGKVVEVIVIVLVPVAVGMWLRTRKPTWAARSENPTKVFSIMVLAVVAIGAVAKEWQSLTTTFAAIGPAVLAFNLVSLLAGYYVARATGLDKPISTAISYEIGIHNATLAIFIALAVLNNFQLALPAAIYSFSMYVTATLFGLLVLRRRGAPTPVIAATTAQPLK